MIVRNCLGKRILLSLCVFAAASLIAPKSHADLQKYVDKPEPAFEWQVKTKIGREQTGDRIYDLQFVSQTWRGEKWRHQLQVYQAADATPGAKMFLWVTGGSASAQTNALGLELARKIKAPVAFVYHIPNQPLLEGNLREDDLIAETFVRYLKSEDDNWPLLLPMVKSVVKAMDVLQAFSKKEWSAPVDQFIVAGASKRGWTTWLTAAVDPRVGFAEVAETHRLVVDRSELCRAFDELVSDARTPAEIGGVLTGQRAHRGEPIDRLHHVEAHADHVGVCARRVEPRVGHVGVGQRAEHARFSHHRVVAVLAEVPRRPSQHDLVAARTRHAKDVVLRAAGELFDRNDRTDAGDR